MSVALPLSNIGRFCSSTIWMRNPSVVTSRRIWLATWRRPALASIASCMRPFNSSSLAISRFCACAACRLIVRFLSGFSVIDFWPKVRERSRPPPMMIEELSPEPDPPCMATLSGVLK